MASNFEKPISTDNYLAVLEFIRDNIKALIKMDYQNSSNIPIGAISYDESSQEFKIRKAGNLIETLPLNISVSKSVTPDANKVSERDSNADLYARLFKSNYANQNSISGAMAFRVNSSSDNGIRFCSDVNKIKIYLGIENLPNAKSDDPTSNSSNILATTKMVQDTSSTSATANKVVKRDGNADITTRLFKSNYANQSAISGALAFRVNSSTNNSIQFCSDKDAIKNWLGVNIAYATKTSSGVTELATDAEAIAGVDELKVLTPKTGMLLVQGFNTFTPISSNLFRTSGTYTVPAGVSKIRVTVVGTGGAGSVYYCKGNDGGQTYFKDSSYLFANGGIGGGPPSYSSQAIGGEGGTAGGTNAESNIQGNKGTNGATSGNVPGGTAGSSGATAITANVGSGGEGIDSAETNEGAGGGGGGTAVSKTIYVTQGDSFQYIVGAIPVQKSCHEGAKTGIPIIGGVLIEESQ